VPTDLGGEARRGWRRARVGALLLTLFVVAAWATGTSRSRRARQLWDRTLEVGVVVLWRGEPPALTRVEAGLGALAARLAAEKERHRVPGPAPFAFRLAGAAPFDGPLPLHPASDGPVARLAHAYRLWRALRSADQASGFSPEPYDVRVYLLLEPTAPNGPAAFAEGSGALGGEVGLVRASADLADPTLALGALAHEVLHCLGATDKYDAGGHALAPQGLAEPDLSPLYPQRYAEWMVGEVPTAPGRGRLPRSLGEVRIGPATAREIGWAVAAAGRPLG
jgi:hypothetical protein